MARTDIRKFDYTKVGTNDAEMWRAYYNHRFFRLFSQLLELLKNQLGLSRLTTMRLAYYAAWAAADYRLHKHKGVNNERVLKNIRKFYKLMSDSNVESFDYKKAAKYELEWWDLHRKSSSNSADLERSLAQAASAIYNVPSEKLQKYAHYRAEAMILPRHEGDKQQVPVDWRKVNNLLVKAWHELYLSVQP